VSPDRPPTCGWSRRENDALTRCGRLAVAVHQVWAVPVAEFLTDVTPQPMALLVCRDHSPRDDA
jgi:hypothetical protein